MPVPATPSAYLFSIEEFSVFDGPGIRTTAFLAGCPLRCEWCHNPEGQAFHSIILRSPNGCLHCGACERARRDNAYTEESLRACPRHLLRHSATLHTPESLAHKLLANADILSSQGGGITLSGGEPLAHIPFLEATLRLLQPHIHTAIQTSGFCAPSDFARILPLADFFLFDLKLLDPALHLRYTGVDNSSILANYRSLVASGKPFITRTPLIPGVTDTHDNLAAIAAFLHSLSVSRIELLPYNKAAGSKYTLAGRAYTPSFNTELPVQARPDLFASYGITSTIL